MDKTTEGEEASPSTGIDSGDPGSPGINPPSLTEQDAPESHAQESATHTRHHSRRIMQENTDAGEPQVRASEQSRPQEPAAPAHAQTGPGEQQQPSLCRPTRSNRTCDSKSL